MNFLYTIIIPHFNDNDRLKKLVSTIPFRDDVEIIIIDDNSDVFPDIKNFPNRNIAILLNDSGVQSAGACRNIGLKKAKGKWLLFADSDDFFTSNAFEILDDYEDCYYDVIYFSPTSIDLINQEISGRHINYANLVRGYIENKDCGINYRFYVPWSKLILNKFVEKNSIYFNEVLASNDIVFSLKIGMKASNFTAFYEEIYCVTKSNNSLTDRKDLKIIHSRYIQSLLRNKLLFDNDLMEYQETIFTILRKYYPILRLREIIYLFNLFYEGKIKIMPNRISHARK